MGLNGVIGRTARGLGGLLLMLVILARSLVAPLAGSRCHHSKCPALRLRETILVYRTSGTLSLRSRCLALMVQGRSLASRPSVTLFPRSRCLPPTIHPTIVTEAWVHRLRNLLILKGFRRGNLRVSTVDSNRTPGLDQTNKLRAQVLNL